MKRRLLSILTGVSALLCVATLILWARGTGTLDVVRWKHVVPLEDSPILEDSFYLAFGVNGVRFYHMEVLQNYGSRSEGGVRLRSRPIQKPLPASKLAGFEKVTVDRDLLGFEFRRGRGAARIKSGWMVGVPYWCFALATGAGPTLRLRALMRRRRRGRAGLCVACGYDLRATPGRCPECGASPSVSDG